MDVILVSGRYPVGDRRSQALAADERLAVGLRAQGCEVRWIHQSQPHENGRLGAAALEVGVELLPVASHAPPFRDVMGRLADGPTELVFTSAVRKRLPDMVHALDFAGTTSANIA